MSVGLYLDDLEITATNIGPALVYRVDPLKDHRWTEFLENHPKASVFHSRAWLTALFKTYGYRPIAYTTSAPGHQLQNGIVACRVESWLTGHRLVSLPFSDHCEPLVANEQDRDRLISALEEEACCRKWRYIELRPLEPVDFDSSLRHTTIAYHFHQLDLRPDLVTIFRSFQKDSIQRKIRRAEREGLTYNEGSTEALLDIFYRLFKITRRRHHVPPQPRKWFRNLMDSFGEALKIRIAFKDDNPIAGMLTLRYNDTLTYKYGCSDSKFNNLGGMHLLYWRSIQEAKNAGLKFFDLGRTNANQTGLVMFKNRWGATHSGLTYSRYAALGSSTHVFDLAGSKWKSRAAKHLLARLHPSVISMIGQTLYKHVG